jgi:hydroxymethylglutaryl-CoA synthase
MNVGVDSIHFDIPQLYLPIETLAIHRSIEPDKLIKGLGLERMSFPDVHQDAVVFAANAVLKLIEKENLNPKEIHRIYVGTESSVDGSKPIASYIIQLLEHKLGVGLFANCDVVDLTFACIGAVDALQNSVDFIRLNPDKKAIVVATDVAKYDLGSTGEYTQGSGAVALLITANPRVLNMGFEYGISTESVFDFFKPIRYIAKKDILSNSENIDWNGVAESEIGIYKEQPVFDGQYSNTCYVNRVKDAYQHYKKVSKQEGQILFENWLSIQMHLPYCFQGRRMFVEVFAMENPDLLDKQIGEKTSDKLKALAKSPEYRQLVDEKIATSEIASGKVGNIYTGSIFMGLLSTLSYHADKTSDIVGQKIGFFAYGSGSKSKVFEASVAADWYKVINDLKLFKHLEQTHALDFDTYEKLHKKELKVSVIQPQREFAMDYIEKVNPVLLGARYYKYFGE